MLFMDNKNNIAFLLLRAKFVHFLIDVVVIVRSFNATRHPRHIEAAAIAMMYMCLYSLAFMDHPCRLGAALSTLYSTQGMPSMS